MSTRSRKEKEKPRSETPAAQAIDRLHDVHDLRHPSLQRKEGGRNAPFLSVRDEIKQRRFGSAHPLKLGGFKANQFAALFGKGNEKVAAAKGDPSYWTDKRVKDPMEGVPPRLVD